MSRRFLLYQMTSDFSVKINNKELSEEGIDTKIEFSFPKDYGDPPEKVQLDGDWGIETLENNRTIRWIINFYVDTIKEDEMKGISVFAHGKLAQNPFLFNLAGGLSGQHGLAYLSGKIEADYLDELEEDIISTERQRINWEHDEAAALHDWGQNKIKELTGIWKNKRSDKKLKILEEKTEKFSERISQLPKYEQNIIKKALKKIAGIESIKDENYILIGDAIIDGWMGGRLKDLVENISNVDDMDEKSFLDILFQTNILTSISIAEAVRAKIYTIRSLKQRIEHKKRENELRDFIADLPWLISPEWETFKKETSLGNIVSLCVQKAGFDKNDYKGRIDLLLSSHKQLLILEFMRPGLTIDWDHAQRFRRYFQSIKTEVLSITSSGFEHLTGYLIADKLAGDISLTHELKSMKKDGMYAMDRSILLNRALKQWKEFLSMIVRRTPKDDRLESFLDIIEQDDA